MRKESIIEAPVFIQFNRAYFCTECQATGNSSKKCPQCQSTALLSTARIFTNAQDRITRDPIIKLNCREPYGI